MGEGEGERGGGDEGEKDEGEGVNGSTLFSISHLLPISIINDKMDTMPSTQKCDTSRQNISPDFYGFHIYLALHIFPFT